MRLLLNISNGIYYILLISFLSISKIYTNKLFFNTEHFYINLFLLIYLFLFHCTYRILS